jgi:hypothetical protein
VPRVRPVRGVVACVAVAALAGAVARGAEPPWRVEKGELRVTVPLKPGGAFEATSTSLAGTLWLRVSPQLLMAFGDTSAGETRTAAELNLFPRTHWSVGLAHYHDRDRRSAVTTRTLLAQLHLYL